MLAASRAHFDRAREFEEQDQLEAARGEYRLAREYDPSNRRRPPRSPRSIRPSATRSKPRGRGRRSSSCASGRAPRRRRRRCSIPTSREPLRMRFRNASIRDILDSLGGATGINITYDAAVPPIARPPCSSTA